MRALPRRVPQTVEVVKRIPGFVGRKNDPATPYLSAIESGRNYAPQEFLDITRPIYAAGLARKSFGPMGCRYWIRPVDQTGVRKDVFRECEAQLWKRFWFRW